MSQQQSSNKQEHDVSGNVEEIVMKFCVSSRSKETRMITFNKSPLALYHERKNNEDMARINNNIDRMYFSVLPQEICKVTENDFLHESNTAQTSDEESESSILVQDDMQTYIASLSELNDSSDSFKDEATNEKLFGKQQLEGQGLNDVCGLFEAKKTLLDVFVYPALYPQLFPKDIQWNRILLYGPPGTGKSILAKAIADEINATLHKISSADLLSRWQGESEKQIRSVFEQARSCEKIVVLFFDEIDGLCRRRSSNEDEAVRRIKTELLLQLEESVNSQSKCQMFIMGATNCPWDIDSAFMRRFHRKIYIPLPDKAARVEILKKGLQKMDTNLTEPEWDQIGNKTEGYSGSDLTNVVMAACCERLYQMMNCKHWIVSGHLWIPAPTGSLFSTLRHFEDIPRDQIGSRCINFIDMAAAVTNTIKTVSTSELTKYSDFLAESK